MCRSNLCPLSLILFFVVCFKVIRIQPKEAIYLKINSKVPGLGVRLDTTKLDLQYHATFKKELPDAYERLLLDVVNGKQLLAKTFIIARLPTWRWLPEVLCYFLTLQHVFICHRSQALSFMYCVGYIALISSCHS